MTHITAESNFSTENEAVENVPNTQVRFKSPVNGVNPVCVKSALSPRKTIYGMQFWTVGQIKAGTIKNADGSISILC